MLKYLSTPIANCILAGLHFISAIVILVTLETYTTEIYFKEPDDIHNVEIKWFLGAFMIITSISHIIYAILNNKYSEIRFFEYSITASLMIFIIQSLSGEKSFDTLFSVSFLIFTTMFFGYIQDMKIYINEIKYFPFIFGCIPYLSAWLIVLKNFSLNTDIPIFVIVIIFIEFVLFSSFAYVQLYYVVFPTNINSETFDILTYNGAYNFLSITSKLLLAWIAYGGIRSLEN